MRFLPSFRPALLALLLLAAAGLRAGLNLDNSLSLRHGVFRHPERGAYVETWLNIHGQGIRYAPAEDEPGRYRGQVAVTLLLRDGETVVDYRKYVLASPLVRDTTGIDFALVDVQRVMLPRPGLTLDITWEDLHQPANRVSYETVLGGDFSAVPAFSDIEFLDGYRRTREPGPFTRNGLELTPYAINYYPHERTTLQAYVELYGTDEALDADRVLLTFSIRERGSETVNPNFWRYQKADAAAVIPALHEFDITDLPTGNYELVAELRDRNNQVLTERRAFFQRLNNRAVEKLENIAMLDVGNTWAERYDAEQLHAFLEFLRPVADPSEIHLIDALASGQDSTMQQRFLFNYWLKRDTVNPYAAWLDYLERVKVSNEKFSTTSTLGYRTDRGYVFLKYGVPNDVIARPSEPGAKPYEIWMYYTLENGPADVEQNNIRFIFYEPTLVSNNYRLIHSNAVGELFDPRWKLRVYGSTADPGALNNFDAQDTRGNYGSNAGTLEDDAGQGIFNEGRP